MELTTGLRQEPQRIVMYGPEAIGKSTLASQLPDPVFIDVEGSTSDLDVFRTPSPSSWRSLSDMTAEFVTNHHGRQTLVIDTADWAERLCIAHVCASHNMTALGGQEDYGRSYNLLETEWCRWLDALSRVVGSGMHVCVLAHAKMRKFEVPDQTGAYDRWELKLERKSASALKEWARCVLFLNYKTYIVAGDRKGDKAKGTGGKRVIFTSHHPVWDAKNRVGLADELPMEYAAIAGLFMTLPAAVPPAKPTSKKPAAQAAAPVAAQPATAADYKIPIPATDDHQSAPQPVDPGPQKPRTVATPAGSGRPAALLPLLELMQRDEITEHEIQLAVGKRGYYPADTPLDNYDATFIAGRLVAHWPKVLEMVNQVRKEAVV
jgi:hypothetical protein